MKKFLIGTLAILMVCITLMSFRILAKEVENPTIESQLSEVKLHDESKQFSQGNIFPFFGENSGFPLEISKTNLLLVNIILSISFFVFAHKNNFETDIYAFYHSNQDGTISFESVEQQQTFEFRSFLGKTFRILGILTAFASVIMIFL